MNKIGLHHRRSLTRTHTAHVVTRAPNAEPVCRLCQLIINEINLQPEKLLEAGPTGKSAGFTVGQSTTERARRRLTSLVEANTLTNAPDYQLC